MSEFLTNLLGGIAGLLTLLVTFLKSDIGKMIVKHFRSAAAQNALLTLNEQAFTIISKYQQTLVADLRIAAKDGKITREELKEALAKIKIQAQEDFVKHAKGGFRHLLDLVIDNESDIAPFLDTLLESAIYKLKDQKGTSFTLPMEGQASSTWASVGKTIPPGGTTFIEKKEL